MIKAICRGQTTAPEAAREYEITQAKIDNWINDAEAGIDNALKTKPKISLNNTRGSFSELKDAYGEAMLELKLRRSCSVISIRPRNRSSAHYRDGSRRYAGPN